MTSAIFCFAHAVDAVRGRGGASNTDLGGQRYPPGIDPVVRGMDGVETRELRYFVAVAEELHFGRAAQRLGIAQPPLSRAIQQLERRLGVALLERTSRGVTLTEAGAVLLREGRAALDAVDAADRRTRRAALAATGDPGLVLVTKAGASSELLAKLLDAYAAEPGAVAVDVVLCGPAEQERLLRDGRADVALLHRPFDSTAGFDTEELCTEGQVAVLPAGHPLTARTARADGRRHRAARPAAAALARPRRHLPGRPRPAGPRPHAAGPADRARPGLRRSCRSRAAPSCAATSPPCPCWTRPR